MKVRSERVAKSVQGGVRIGTGARFSFIEDVLHTSSAVLTFKP